MANKTYVDPLLTQFSLGYRPLGFLSEKILPRLPVKKATGKVGSYGADNLRIVTTYKGDEAETATITSTTTISDGWVLEPHALKAFASDREAANEDKPFDVQRDKAQLTLDIMGVNRENALASFMGTVGNFTNNTTLSGTSQWGGSADDPIGDINTAIGTCSDAIGVPESMLTMHMSKAVWRKLRFLTEILEFLGYSGRNINVPAKITPAQLAEAFGIKEILVAESFYNSAAEGQTDSLAPIWGKHCWLGHYPKPSQKIQPFGYTCFMKGAVVTDKWYNQDRKGWWIRNSDEYDQLITNELAVYMIEDAIA